MHIDALMEKATKQFLQKNYQEALDVFLTILRQEPLHKPAQLGVMLCDLLEEDEEEAVALFDFYLVLKQEAEEDAEERVIEMIHSLDKAQEDLASMLEQESVSAIEGIAYKDFKRIVQERGSFKRAFEDIMFSTKVIITQKSDFFDFLNNLLEYGFKDIAYSYLEDASKLYPADRRLQEFMQKLKQ
ncbi:hypothetical protein [Nitratiruptor sp. YY09-18]|uniref:hypothetical protein n=1 Tax=Nitratiruptor sp. YY09-18 TaxID=2724901 RepID=UPI0019151704|nr:hypothetical protein [Nitratiruptor sp. YY09-18]BCD67388.1 hypothetical protein NitYY0918_C0273 [Nitratiruptor sp. YY09-18]